MEYRIVYDKVKDRYKAQKKGESWWIFNSFWCNIIIPTKFFYLIWTHSEEDVKEIIENDKKWEGIKEIIKKKRIEMKKEYKKKKRDIGKKRYDSYEHKIRIAKEDTDG